MDEEEVTMLIRAILASKKDPISISELRKEYQEANGEDIPYKALGFATVIKYLESIPNKVCLRNDMNGSLLVAPVIDKEIMGLSRLVQGQKRTKKKKKSSKSNFGYNRFRPRPNENRSFFSQNNNNNNFLSNRNPSFNNNNNNSNNNNNRFQGNRNFLFNNRDDKRAPVAPRFSQAKEAFSNFLPLQRAIVNIREEQKPQIAPRFSQAAKQGFTDYLPLQRTIYQTVKPIETNQLVPTRSKTPELVIDENGSYWIENAAYHLREHEVLVLNVLSVDEICIRLTNCQFSKEYDSLLTKMKVYYTGNPKKCIRFDANQICVAKNSNGFYRVQVIELLNDMAYCCYVDEGYNDHVKKDNLYQIQKEFLNLNFQTITLLLDDFEEFNDNVFIRDMIEQIIYQKKYIAKKTETKPLKIRLYDQGSKESLNEEILACYSHFKVPKLTPKKEFDAFVSYFDDRKKLTYLQIDDEIRREKLDQMCNDFAVYFNDSLNLKKCKVNPDDIKENKLFCNKYTQDGNWYRVRVLVTSSTINQKVLVDFVDYGNEDYILKSELYAIPNEFAEYKYMPFQAIGVIVTNIFNSTRSITDFLGDEKPALVTVNSVNINKIPYVEIKDYENSKESTETESVDQSEVDEEEEQKNEEDNDKTIIEKENKEPTTRILSEIKAQDSSKNSSTENLNRDNAEGLISKFSSLLNVTYGIIEKVHYTHLVKSNLPPKTSVHVTSATDPSNFTIIILEQKLKYENLAKEMSDFYSNKQLNHVTEETLLKDHIYVLKSDDQYKRVKFVGYASVGVAKLFNIDSGKYDIGVFDDIYYITKRFTTIPMFALDAKLAYVTCDSGTEWSARTSSHFCSLVETSKTFQASLVSYQINDDRYAIDLFDNKTSICNLLIAGGYANPIKIEN